MSKKIIHFAHANGFPAKTYTKLFSYLADDYEINFFGETRAQSEVSGCERLGTLA